LKHSLPDDRVNCTGSNWAWRRRCDVSNLSDSCKSSSSCPKRNLKAGEGLLQWQASREAYWWRGDSDETNQYMGMIRRPWWTEAKGQIWPGCRGYTPTLLKDILGFLMTTESGPRFNVSSEGRCSLTV